MQQQQLQEAGQYLFISEGILIIAELDDKGQLVKTVGTTVKAEQIEMNLVKITKDGQEEFVRLGDKVRWMPEKEELLQ